MKHSDAFQRVSSLLTRALQNVLDRATGITLCSYKTFNSQEIWHKARRPARTFGKGIVLSVAWKV